jgi:hypothetical protein
MRRWITALVVVGLAGGVWLLWPRGSDDSPTADVDAGDVTTTLPPDDPAPSSSTSTTTTTSPTTTTTRPHVVETVAEAEEILRDLWFGWFEGIYEQDEDRIREVVVLEEAVSSAKESFGTMEFSRPPGPRLIELTSSELLRADADCLALWSHLDVSRFRPEATGTSGVYVMRRTETDWKLLSVWPLRDDLWESDCDASLS